MCQPTQPYDWASTEDQAAWRAASNSASASSTSSSRARDALAISRGPLSSDLHVLSTDSSSRTAPRRQSAASIRSRRAALLSTKSTDLALPCDPESSALKLATGHHRSFQGASFSHGSVVAGQANGEGREGYGVKCNSMGGAGRGITGVFHGYGS